MKKILSVLLTAALMLSLFAIAPLTVSAAKSGDYEYSLADDGTAAITKYTGYDDNVTIPKEIDGLSVTVIEKDAFNLSYIRTVTIPDTVKTIQNRAFYSCRRLQSVVIPESVTELGIAAFRSCDSLKSVVINANITQIGTSCFAECTSLTDIVISDTVTVIKEEAFSGCTSLKKITIPNSVEKIEKKAFSGCTALEDIGIPDTLTKLGESVYENTAWYKNKENNSVVYAGKICYTYKGISCPETVEIRKGTVGIADNAFGDSPLLKNVTFPNSLRSIGDYSFNTCREITELVLPDSVTYIGEGAFAACTGLVKVKLPSHIKKISDFAFWVCAALTSIEIPKSVTSIGYNCFDGCYELSDITVYNKLINVGINAFGDTAWYWAQPEGQVFLGDILYTYKGTCPAEVTIDTGVRVIADRAFGYQSELEKVVLPDTVKYIGEEAFRSCEKLKSIDVPDSVKVIGNSAFVYCKELESFTIPESLTEIRPNTFFRCEKLKSIEIPNHIVKIGYSAFESCESLETVTIPDSVVYIGNKAFYDCDKMRSAIVPDTVNKIGYRAFGFFYIEYSVWYDTTQKISGFILYGYNETNAMYYSTNYDIAFVSIGEKPFRKNAVNALTDVSVTASENAEVVIEQIDTNNVDLPEEFVAIVMYDITLTRGGERIQPEGTVIVEIPTDYPDASVFRVEEDNTLTDMNAVYEDGYMVFASDHFSNYLLAVPYGDIVDEMIGVILGDTDGDGEVSILDATEIQRHLASLPTQSFDETAADTDRDGEVTILDATKIQRHLAGLPTQVQGIGKPIA